MLSATARAGPAVSPVSILTCSLSACRAATVCKMSGYLQKRLGIACGSHHKCCSPSEACRAKAGIQKKANGDCVLWLFENGKVFY